LRTKFIKNLTSRLEQERTSQTVTNVLIYYITAWINNEPKLPLISIAPEASVALQTAVKDQELLGWDQIFCGRISMEWSNAYQQDLRDINQGTARLTTIKWGKVIVSMAYELVLQCWNIRNELEYNESDDTSETTSKKKIIRKNIMVQ
jgi:hypothetical protein